MINKLKLREIFSRAAKDYDRHALFQAEISEGLLNKIKRLRSPLDILDIGIGTGRLTNGLSLIFPEAKIFGLDFASGMLEQARNKKSHPLLIQADAQFLPFKKDSFDLAVSNLSYQWLDNLEDAFNQVRNVLKEEGRFLLTIFGKETLRELRISLSEVWQVKSKQGNFSYLQLPDEDFMYRALVQSGFKDIKMNREIKIQTHKDLFNLLKWLKATGSNYSVGNHLDNLGSRQILKDASEIYKARFHDDGRLYATFEVIYAEARK